MIVGIDAALGGAHPVLELGSWLGLGPIGAPRRRARRHLPGPDRRRHRGDRAGVAFAGRPPGRWLTALGSCSCCAVAVAIGADNAFLFFLAWEALTVCIYLIASADRRPPGDAAGQGYLTAGSDQARRRRAAGRVRLLYAHTHSFSLADLGARVACSAGTRGVAVRRCSSSASGPRSACSPAGGAARRLWRRAAARRGLAVGGPVRRVLRTVALRVRRSWDRCPPGAATPLLILGALTALVGIVYAITQDDLRRFLGYSTVEHAGIVLLGLGVALLGQSAHNRHPRRGRPARGDPAGRARTTWPRRSR